MFPTLQLRFFRILSPELIRLFIVLMMGKPAPTLVSNRNFTSFFAGNLLEPAIVGVVG